MFIVVIGVLCIGCVYFELICVFGVVLMLVDLIFDEEVVILFGVEFVLFDEVLWCV